MQPQTFDHEKYVFLQTWETIPFVRCTLSRGRDIVGKATCSGIRQAEVVASEEQGMTIQRSCIVRFLAEDQPVKPFMRGDVLEVTMLLSGEKREMRVDADILPMSSVVHFDMVEVSA